MPNDKLDHSFKTGELEEKNMSQVLPERKNTDTSSTNIDLLV